MKKLYPIVFALLFGSSAVHAQVFVTPAGAGAANGNSWANALPGNQLRASMFTAPTGTQYWLAAGTYKPDTASRDSSFTLNPGVQLYGGFNGTETSLSQRNWATNETIFSGDIGVAGDSTDNTWHVIVCRTTGTGFGIDTTTAVNGITVRNGNATGGFGAGIYIATTGTGPASYLTVKHCHITHNRTCYGGGGMYNYAYGAPLHIIIDSCLFDYNTCDSGGVPHKGGGALFSDAEVATLSTNISNATFQYNSADYNGGALNIKSASGYTISTLKNCIIQYNSAGYGGGINFNTFNDYVSYGHFSASIDSCLLNKNQGYFGGAIYTSLDRVYTPVLTIQHTTFLQNNAADGAGVFEEASSSDIPYGEVAKEYYNNDIFRQNTAGIGDINAIDADIFALAVDSTFITNCLFDKNNVAVLGNRSDEGALATMLITNSTIYCDSPGATLAYHSGIIYNNADADGYDTTVSNFIFQNSILYWPAMLIFVPPAINNNSVCQVSHSVIRNSLGSGPSWNTADGTDLGGNMDVYPDFCDTFNNNMNLRCASPCINAGYNTFIYPDTVLHDLNNNNRIYNTTVDIGAYEYNAIPPHAIPVVMATVADTSVIVGNFSTGQQDTIKWDFGDGTYSNVYFTSHKYADTGTYNVCLHIYSCDGDADSCIKVYLGTGGNDSAAAVPAVSKSDTYSLYPNPANTNIYIKGLTDPVSVAVYNTSGVAVLMKNCLKTDHVINVSNLNNGIYFIKITNTETGENETRKILVLH